MLTEIQVWKFCRFVTFLGQFNLQRFMTSVKSSGESPGSVSSWLKSFQRHLKQKSLYALGLCSEVLLTPDDTLMFGLDSYGYIDKQRIKAVFHHKVSVSLQSSHYVYCFKFPCVLWCIIYWWVYCKYVVLEFFVNDVGPELHWLEVPFHHYN